MFSKILIANRGEIACRIIRTARSLGIATVAVYSDADQHAQHVELADEAVRIGPAPPRDSYLNIEAVLSAAETSGAQAVHPGYGFLSENAEFAEACDREGLTFIGPTASVIRSMGSKATAKTIMEAAGVPLIPGYHGDDQSPERLRSAARDMGYPVLLKATAGGGGKGMRLVETDAEFMDALQSAQREASASFGDDRMLVERFIGNPRHVEVQVFSDNQGNGIYLAERDCSVQRRHQKVIEEAPAPGLSDELRSSMGETAVRAAQAINYRGAGTVEFLLDQQGRFYFMEMNTRLQVEHPVTEMITRQNLVAWQIKVASGEPLPLSQEQVTVQGHAFEARIYAEDPENDFLPETGRLDFLRSPEESRHVRVDTGVRQGDEVSVYYDPMIAKLIVWDETRERALQRLATTLADYRIGGTVTNVEFLYNLATCAPFARAQLDTGFIEKHRELIFRDAEADVARDLRRAAVALLLHRDQRSAVSAQGDPYSPWHQGDAWRLNEPHVHRLTLNCHGEDHEIQLEVLGNGYRVVTDEEQTTVSGTLEGDTLQLDEDGHRRRGTLARTTEGFTLYMPEGACHFREVTPDTGERDARAGGNALAAPMNGTVVALLVATGDAVEDGAPLLVMEAMKMEHTLKAPGSGTVKGFHCAEGELVDGGAELVDFAPDTASGDA